MRSAIISNCGKFRYALERQIGGGCGNVLFVMLNPSTADAEKDDPTIRRCMAFAKRWEYAGLLVANLYAWRATDPRELTHTPDQVGPEWKYRTACLAARAGKIIVAWGNDGAAWRRSETLQLLRQYNTVYCLGKTKDGSPKHPLARGKHRIPADFEPVVYE